MMQLRPMTSGRRAVLVGLVAALATFAHAGCDSPDEVVFEYRKLGEHESFVVHGVPTDVEALASVQGRPPTPLGVDRSVEIPPGLSGRVSVSVQWQRGGFVKVGAHKLSMIDLDAERRAAAHAGPTAHGDDS